MKDNRKNKERKRNKMREELKWKVQNKVTGKRYQGK